MIDIGTTTLQLARHLHGRKLTVITSNLAVDRGAAARAGIELVLLGGTVRRNYRSLVGVLAEDALRQLSCDVAFLGASGLHARSLGDGHDDGRGADQARDDRRGPSGRPPRRRGQVRDARLVRVCGAGRPRRPSSPTRRADRGPSAARATPASRWCTREDRDPRRRRVPRADGLRRAARARGAARARAGLAPRRRRGPARADRAGARRARSASAASGSPFRATTDLDEALEGADFVFCAIRVGQLEGRVVDEQRAAPRGRRRPGDDRARAASASRCAPCR